ncbi:TetR/AcrR family transcriptional regulator [Rhodocytophaga aerolata]|uniref:TetR/AcrR family transcriptional regulator n=2 Tax=Rhodocytophaga aerolata TaxID=455078 RepID=A0ABT8RG79_9BACT|nr:TetR/AcrR family transcriptional regulator [Rhodocytophaga aerolata]MDO1451115.1 TetR/AcrR family transcriptional regulator [Rhodocytophaga aerolata]
MNKGHTSREQIIWKAYQLFRERGYYNTSMETIGKACGLLKGSIYHYFTSKEHLMEGVLGAVHDSFKRQVFSVAFSPSESAKERLEKMMEATEQAYFQEQGGCIMGQTGGYAAINPSAFTRIIQAFFTEWREAFTHIFSAQYSFEQSKQLSWQAIQEIEGAITLYCIFFDKTFFAATRHRIEGLLV